MCDAKLEKATEAGIVTGNGPVSSDCGQFFETGEMESVCERETATETGTETEPEPDLETDRRRRGNQRRIRPNKRAHAAL